MKNIVLPSCLVFSLNYSHINYVGTMWIVYICFCCIFQKLFSLFCILNNVLSFHLNILLFYTLLGTINQFY